MFQNTIRHINVLSKRKLPIMSFTRTKAAYEGEGKTTVRVLNNEYDLGLMIDSFATYGFKLNNGITVLGPMAIFPRTVLSWQVADSDDVTEESLKLFKLLEPRIDLLILGLDTTDRSKIDKAFRAARANELNIEILATEHACSTFNFLNAEGRSVAAALIPPFKVNMNEDDMLEVKMHYSDIFQKGFSKPSGK
ncbi:NADH dehydrogenase [ubiquinone] 1 alpha subcomplex assembly factor 3 [Bombyx mandarina]|uniref:NADH dehydrogenase [ubiquinone] 1 alpha subcomplex assembly factor 3 n=1 Tax=Bombyx mandarina TaxID=7092 RepID=A0A6J2JYE9_BOMMA|nr:NADH dehydrogenase [ubiquinone] 1 alpha subcomplex assembly factor 3 [Bombyx mandarina]